MKRKRNREHNIRTPSDLSWNPASETLKLDIDEIHVWRAGLNIPSEQLHHYHQILSIDERGRGARFKFQKDRDHFIAAHGILRIILSRYIDINPKKLHYSYNDFGKPFLDQSTGSEKFRFNMSHSMDLALFAVAHGHEIGIDLECIRPIDKAEQIAERFFSPREVEQFRALPEHRRNEAFFRCWTRKEAYIKARGKGLSLSLKQFDVSLSPDEPAMLLDSREDPEETSRWSLVGLTPRPGFAAALAVEGHDLKLKYWQWSE